RSGPAKKAKKAKKAPRPPPLFRLIRFFRTPSLGRKRVEASESVKATTLAPSRTAHHPLRRRLRKKRKKRKKILLHTNRRSVRWSVGALTSSKPSVGSRRSKTGGGFSLHGVSRLMRSAGQPVGCLASTLRPSSQPPATAVSHATTRPV